jgi:hypothetical protein
VDQSAVDQGVFFRVGTAKKGLIRAVAQVDDLTIMTSNMALMTEVEKRIASKFQISDGCEVYWVLGIAVKRDRDARTIGLSQTSYLKTTLEGYGFADTRPLSVRMDPNTDLSRSQCPKTTWERVCRNAVVKLSARSFIRPDIPYAVSILAKFNQSRGLGHGKPLRRVYAYLAGTLVYKLAYGGENDDLLGYTDADGSMH